MGRKTLRKGSSPSLPDPAVFDLSQLRRYTLYQTSLEVELIGLFRQQLPQFLEQLGASATANDWKFATHSLKGSAATIGAMSIAIMAEQLELLGFNGDSGKRQTLMVQLSKAIADFDQAIRVFYR